MSNNPPFESQTDTPLFPNALYNRPLTRHGAGRLLVAGGHSGEFSLPTAIYQLALAAGLGECHVVLPDTLAKILGGSPGTYFAASNPSGSLGVEALGKILELSETADAVALGASLSSNSTTAMLIEKLASAIDRPIIFFGDALTILRHNVQVVTDNPKALIIASMPEVFKLCGLLGIPIQIRPNAGLINKLEIVQDLRSALACQVVVYGTETIDAADTSMVVTPTNYRLALVPALYYSVLSTFWLQNPSDRRTGLATGAFVLRQVGDKFSSTDKPTIQALADALESSLKSQDDF